MKPTKLSKLKHSFDNYLGRHKTFFISGLTALLISFSTSLITYKIVSKRVPQIAVVDLAYLNNEFITNLARHLANNNVSEEKTAEAVKVYLSSLENLLKDINQNNYLLLQKQTVVSQHIPDITKSLEKALFENIMQETKLK